MLAVWTAPADGAVNVTGRLWDVDTSCGNGVDWRLALLPVRSAPAYVKLDRGDLDNGGGPAAISNDRAANVNILSGDRIALDIGDRGNTNCDLTNVELSITPTTAPAYAYVAMGDSYSSGEGSPENTFFGDTVSPHPDSGGTTGCHRSSIGWPTTVAASRKIQGPRWKFAACSGAKAYEFHQRNDTNKSERPQLVWLSTRPASAARPRRGREPTARASGFPDSTIIGILAAMASMRRPSFLILSALALGPLHGYGVIKEVSRLSADGVRLGAGTLYAALDRLSEEGLVEIDREETVDGRLRRYYRLTRSGTAALVAEAEQMRRDARMVAQRLRGAGSVSAPRPA